MDLYAAGEIVKKLHGVTTRQILDIAEKGLITPARDTTGAGSPRLYDFNNIFDISICLAVRGRIPGGVATQELIGNILQTIRDETSAKQNEKKDALSKIVEEQKAAAGFSDSSRVYPPPFDLLVISYDNKDNYTFYPTSYDDTFGGKLQRVKKYRPQNYCTYIIEVKTLWEYLKAIF